MTAAAESGVVIRDAAPGDAAALAGLHGRCITDPWSAASIAAALTAAGGLGCVAETTGAVAGFALLRVVAGECEVLTVVVAPELRRRGIGRALLGASLAGAAACGARTVFLEVAVDNREAQALYRRFGFAPVGRRRRYYGTTDAQVLALGIMPGG